MPLHSALQTLECDRSISSLKNLEHKHEGSLSLRSRTSESHKIFATKPPQSDGVFGELCNFTERLYYRFNTTEWPPCGPLLSTDLNCQCHTHLLPLFRRTLNAFHHSFHGPSLLFTSHRAPLFMSRHLTLWFVLVILAALVVLSSVLASERGESRKSAAAGGRSRSRSPWQTC